ncbi:MAG TPA: hypothetical protein DEF41_04500 [Desulfovibrio sp.]|uniref:Uncharacterized protein n=1 Tax=Nitratidesulfovibrio vulgaris (strain ATCC 29579 / DSM 644 / CCUG 34227 / NCIMB 8303 / VKM B-1760 / Hildenborough) TaxID=882 RepID=Q72B45_NITV2|nr:hypothetical protein DVU_1793 [Nitratidesulfovibrio vulgaris str. Hildenborough]HBW15396.1 hypothetical protein [Desulfovibrio sp.]
MGRPRHPGLAFFSRVHYVTLLPLVGPIFCDGR